jgi:hypothetical protein
MYSCAVDLEVEDKTGRRERLVDSTHFRTMNVQEGPFFPSSCMFAPPFHYPSYPILSYPILLFIKLRVSVRSLKRPGFGLLSPKLWILPQQAPILAFSF